MPIFQIHFQDTGIKEKFKITISEPILNCMNNLNIYEWDTTLYVFFFQLYLYTNTKLAYY